MIGLVAGFPLLLMCFMLSLEKLESWGLRESDPVPEPPQPDRVEAAVEQVEQLAATQGLGATVKIDDSQPVGARRTGSGG